MKRLALLLSVVLLTTACSTGEVEVANDATTSTTEVDATTSTTEVDATTSTTEVGTTTTIVDDSVEIVIMENKDWVNESCNELLYNSVTGVSLEKVYLKEQMDELLATASDLHYLFIQQCIGDDDFFPWYNWVYPGTVGESQCYLVNEDGTKDYSVDDLSLFYCELESSVWVGLEELWFYYESFGAAAAATITMREVGHHIQELQNVPWDLNPPRLREMQTDCIAGAFVGWAVERGYLGSNDMDDIDRMIDYIGSDNTDADRYYGNDLERSRSFEKGGVGGLEVCSEFSPNNGLPRLPHLPNP